MKVSIVIITSNYDGNVEVTTKPFITFEKASKYLYKEYLGKPLSEKSHHLLHTDHHGWDMPLSPKLKK